MTIETMQLHDKFPDDVKILIVDDDKAMQVFLEEVLLNAGYNIFTAPDAEQALSIASEQLPDIILMDVVMPDLNGFQICRRLKAQTDTKDIPIIFLTMRQQIEDKSEGFLSGGVDYLTKPFNSEELLIRIEKHMEMYWLRRSLEKMLATSAKQMDFLQKNLQKANEFIIKYDSPYKRILSILEEGVIELDEKGRCLFSNESAAYMLGYNSPNEILGEFIYKKDNKINHNKKNTTLIKNNLIRKNTISDVSLLKKDKSELLAEIRIKPINNNNYLKNIVISFSDTSIRKSIESNLSTLAYKDPLTGLSNRTIFMENLQSKIHNYRTNKKNLSLFILDLDRFKEINDSLGHLAGDHVLCEVARRLEESVQGQGEVARLGGDEYSFITDSFTRETDLLNLAHRVSARLSEPYEFSHSRINLTASIGLAVCDEYSQNAEDLITYADWALYKAKESRNGAVRLFKFGMLSDLNYELEIARELSQLVARKELIIEYQPQFNIHTNDYIGAEALLRWDNPGKGHLLPFKFLPIAEKRGFIKDISYHAIRIACEQIKKWKEENVNFGVISVNICAQQLNESSFFNRILTILNENEINPEEIAFEFTETALISIHPQTQLALTELARLGIKFAIDDFGTGFSSMRLLKTINCDKLKIDKEFIDGINIDEKCTKITKSLINLAKSLNMKVVAEGVETREQLDFLIANGCDIAQGFYFSQSLPPEELRDKNFPVR